MKWIVIVFAGLLVIGLVATKSRSPRQAAPGGSADPSPAPRQTMRDRYSADFSAEAAKKRDEWIANSQAKNIVGDVKVSNHVGKVVVGPSFILADFKTKQQLVGVIYAWCLDRDPDCGSVVIRESRNNKEIGDFNGYTGKLTMN